MFLNRIITSEVYVKVIANAGDNFIINKRKPFHFISPRLRDLGGLSQLHSSHTYTNYQTHFLLRLENLIFLVSFERLVFVCRINY